MTAGMADVLMQIDGRPAGTADLGHFVLSNYGAFTSMQVEDGGVRGLDLHLARLEAEAVIARLIDAWRSNPRQKI